MKEIEEPYIAFIKAEKGFSMYNDAASFELPFVPLIHVDDWQHFLDTAVKLEVATISASSTGEQLYSFTGRTTLPEMPLDEAIAYLNLQENYQVRGWRPDSCNFAP